VTCDSRGGTVFVGRESVNLFKVGRRLPAKVETALKNSYAISSVVVEFYEIFASNL
jgi:hypothetical protein